MSRLVSSSYCSCCQSSIEPPRCKSGGLRRPQCAGRRCRRFDYVVDRSVDGVYPPPYRARGPAAPVCWLDCEPTRATLHNCGLAWRLQACTSRAWRLARRMQSHVAYHYVGTGRAIAAYVPLRRRHGGTRLAPTRAPVIRSAARRHAGAPTCPQRQTASPWGAFAPQAADRLVHRRKTPHHCGKTRPRISTACARCGETRQTTYCYAERTITYTKGRVSGPSCLTPRNRYTFVVIRTAGTASQHSRHAPCDKARA